MLLADNLGSRRKLGAVNSFMNRWPYRQDRELYGSSEHWATPREFMSRAGDCEDYAIAKYFALRQVGFGLDDLRIVILRDEIRNVGHAAKRTSISGGRRSVHSQEATFQSQICIPRLP